MAESDQAGRSPRYGLLLITLTVAYLASAITSSRWAVLAHMAFVAIVGLLALRQARLRRRYAVPAAVVIVASAALAGVGATSRGALVQGIAAAWNGVLLLVVVVVIIGRVLRLEQVTVQSIYGAISAYLLIGLMFAGFYGAVEFLVPGPFFADGQPANAQTLQYFSFTTLTTLGYGDFTAVGSLGRSLAVLEALVGQVFLATLVARLVSAYHAGGGRRPPPDDRAAG